jgi:hypothetical protein
LGIALNVYNGRVFLERAMRIKLLLTMGAAFCAALPAMAQIDGTLKDGPKPAIKTSKDAPPAMPVPGETSFTEDQASDRMMKRGYNLVSIPLKGRNGIWYAEGRKDNGETVQLMMDYQGNVFEGRSTDAEGADHATPRSNPADQAPPKPISPQQH